MQINKSKKTKKLNSKKNVINSNNTIWIYGFHAVKAAIENTDRKKIRFLCTKNAQNKLGKISNKISEITKIVDISEFNKFLNPNSVHQGLALEVEPLKRNNFEKIILSQSNNDVIIILDRIKDPQNVGAIIRSSEILGCKAIIGSIHHCSRETGSLVKAASGAFEKLPYFQVTNISRKIDILRENGYLILGLDQSGNYSIVDLLKKLKKQSIAYILGSEEKGMRFLTKKKCDYLVRIDTNSRLNVLNVSNAAAISLFAFRELL